MMGEYADLATFIVIALSFFCGFFLIEILFNRAEWLDPRAREIVREIKSGKARVTEQSVRLGYGHTCVSTAFKIEYSKGYFIFELDPTDIIASIFIVNNSIPKVSDKELEFIIRGSRIHSLCLEIMRSRYN